MSQSLSSLIILVAEKKNVERVEIKKLSKVNSINSSRDNPKTFHISFSSFCSSSEL